MCTIQRKQQPEWDTTLQRRPSGRIVLPPTPNNEVGWVTYTFEGSETQLQFFVDVVNPKSKDYQYQKWDVSKWENLPNSAKGNLHWYYKGANHTNVDESTYTAWITSEFGYTSEAVMRFSPKANVIVTKADAETGEVLAGATFTCYEWTGSGWKDIGNLEWQNVYKYYWKTGLERNGTNQGRFKVVETKNPSGYTGSWEKEFTITEEGTVTLKYDANQYKKERYHYHPENGCGKMGRRLLGQPSR